MEKAMAVLEVLSIGLLWTVTALNLCSLILNIRQYKKYRASASDYIKATIDCDAAAADFERARDNYIQATKALEEDAQ